MSQPFKGSWRWSLEAIEERPELAVHIGRIITKWAMAEHHLAMMLSTMLGADAMLGPDLMLIVKAEGPRLSMIEAVGKQRLAPELQAEYTEIQREYKAVAKLRDALAHNLAGVSDEHPDSLIFTDSRTAARLHANLTASFADRRKGHDPDALTEQLGSAREYKKADFLRIERDITALCQRLTKFDQALRPPLDLRFLEGMRQ